MDQLLATGFFPPWFLRRAFMEQSRQALIEDSPHPYPRGVRVTAAVTIPEATSLVVHFDHRSLTEVGVDFVMFSRARPGGNDIGSVTGNFGGRKFEVPGNSFVWSFISDPDSSSRLWGFRFLVTPVFPPEVAARFEQQAQLLFETSMATAHLWSREADQELVGLIDSVCHNLTLHPLSLRAGDVDFHALRESSSLLKGIPVDLIEHRFSVLSYFSSHISQILGILNLHYAHLPSSIAGRLSQLRTLIFLSVKTDFLDAALLATESPLPRPQLTLCRMLPGKQTAPPLALQVLNQISSLSPLHLRHPECAFSVKFLNEGAQDEGGPYREAITAAWDDLLSGDNGLHRWFLPCSNAIEQIGDNRDTILPNPQLTDPLRIDILVLVGILIGIAIRTKQTISKLAFPPLIWKLLVSWPPNLTDLAAIDLSSYNTLQTIRSVEDPEVFASFGFDCFTTVTLDGREVNLQPGGEKRSITFDNRLQYAELLEKFRLAEFNEATSLIRRGIGKIVPVETLLFLNWNELEFRVCGRREIDIGLLRRNTIYLGLSPADESVIAFWNVLESLTPAEKILFLRFVWGRSSLPAEAHFTQKFSLRAFQPASSNVNAFLPVSSTCTFTLALPPYSNQAILRERLLYAISSCHVIDRDFNVGPDVVRSLESSYSQTDESQTEDPSLF